MTTAFILPWLRLNEPFELTGGIVLLPLSAALEKLDEPHRASLHAAASTFYDRWPIESTIADLRELQELTTDLSDETIAERTRALHVPKPLLPAIVLTGDVPRDINRVRIALDTLAFASVVENQRFNYANSAVFASFRLRLAGTATGFLTDTTIRLYGRALNTVEAARRIDMRPHQVPDDPRIGARPEFLRPLIQACRKRSGATLIRALENLRMATSDAPDLSESLKESLFALAAELIADIPPQSQKRGKSRTVVINQRLHSLLDPLFQRGGPTSSRRRRGRKSATLIRVFWAVRRKRNSFWHPAPDRRRGPRFSRQLLVTPLVIAINMTYALTIARLVELGALPTESDLVADVYACTDWLAHLGPELQTGLVYPDDVREDRSAWAKAMVAWNAASERAANFGSFRTHERLVVGVSKAVTALRRARPFRS